MIKIKRTIPDWLIGGVLTLIFLFISITGVGDFTESLEMKTLDLRTGINMQDEKNPDIELVVISDDDLSELGRFPWPRNILATAIENLAKAGARVVALNIVFPEPEESAGLKALKGLKESARALKLPTGEPWQNFQTQLEQAIVDLDNDTKLANVIKSAGNVVLPIYFDMQSEAVDKQAPDFISGNAFKNLSGLDNTAAQAALIRASKVKPLLPSFAINAVQIGHLNLFPDNDGSIRNQIHVLGYLKDIYFPSFPFAIVKAFKGLKSEDIRVVLGEEIQIKLNPSTTIKVPAIDAQMRTQIVWNSGPNISFHQTKFSKVFKNQIQPSNFKDKIVVIGPTAPGIGDSYVTPVSAQLPGIEVVANSVANILSQKFIARPAWVVFLELGLLLIFGLYITWLLPRLKATRGALITLLLFISSGVFGTFLFLSQHIWLKIAPPMLLLALGYLLVISKSFLISEKTKEKVEADSVETNKMLGLSFQQQGMLDLALEKFRKIPLEEEGVKDLLYNLGLDFERKRQFSKALSTYNLIIADKKEFKDLTERVPKLKDAEATMIFGSGGGSSHPGDIGATISYMDTKPTLGRYQISGELGRGAMGVVYKGEDPKIHRTVAIKTIRLADFDEDMVDEMKARFFREAESAGLLTHPNIVTIYDCGEEHDLAYIAMEFLNGTDLVPFAGKEKMLPLREALDIVAKVAEALDYAHAKGIVHRDIKPANIMRITETKEIKVTDFGIARITSSSKTKTGVVMGTPSYMSPEQVAGKKVDGRSDIFSLGVVLFEMLAGQKPFRGDDMTSVMYKIAHEKHPSIKTVNPKVPAVLDKILDIALEKEPEKRYQKAGQMADHLHQIITKLDNIAKRS